MKLLVGLLITLGFGGIFALPVSADTRVQVHLDTPGLQFVTYGRDRYRSHNRYNRQHRGQRRYRSSRYRGYSNRRHYNGRSYNSRSYHRGYSTRGYSSRNRAYRNDYRSSYSGSSCQRVTKRGYWHGRPALIGGRECVNRRGYAYIAPNSRYLIRYY